MPPEIDFEKCICCGRCTDICTEDVYFGTEGFGKTEGAKPMVTYPEACVHCYRCVEECPVSAIWLRTPLSDAHTL